MKKTRTHIVNCDSLTAVIAFADSVIKDNPGMTYSDFSFDTYEPDPWGDYKYPSVEYQTEETDKERVDREKSEEARRKNNEAWERRQYEALQKKFGAKS